MSIITEFDSINLNESQSNSNKFTIPKRSAPTELIQTIEDENSYDYELIAEEIKQSFLDKQTSNELGYALTRVQFINNIELEDQYSYHKKERMKNEEKLWNKNLLKKGKKGKIGEKTVFFVCYSDEQAFEIAKNGFKCEEGDNYLADSSKGIHFCKHLDVLLKYEYTRPRRTQQLIVLMAKVFYDPNKLQQTTPSLNNKQVVPNHGNDGFISIIQLSTKKQLMQLYFESLVYFYEMDEAYECSMEPKNMKPAAILKYELKNPSSRSLFQKIQKTFCSISKAIQNKNQNRYFNRINLNQEESVQQNQIVNRNIKPKSEFLQADFIPFINNNNSKKLISSSSASSTASISINFNNFVKQAKQNQQKELEESQQNVVEVISDACRLVKNFKPEPSKTEASIYSDDDEPIDDLQILEDYFAMYADRFKQADEKMPKWRIIYERSGNLDTIFYGSRQMKCQLNNIRNFGFKYNDSDELSINLNEPTNKFILQYQSKRNKKLTRYINDNNIESNSIIVKYVKKEDINDLNHVKSFIRFGPNWLESFVFVDFSYLPVIRYIKTMRSIESIAKTEPETEPDVDRNSNGISRDKVNKMLAKLAELRKNGK